MNSKEILANYVLKNVDEAALIDMALEALVEGYDSQSLRILAGENKKWFNAFEVRGYFRRALNELNWPLPSPQEAAQILICYWAKCIVSGDVSPLEGAQHINHDVERRLLDRPGEKYLGESLGIARLIGLQYEYDDLQEGFIEYEGKSITKAEAFEILDQEIRSEASEYLEKFCAR